MSIASEIARIEAAKASLKNKINAKNDNEHQITNETIDEFGDFVQEIPTGVTPTGTINITTNGTTDVTNYASANVNVSSDYNAKFNTTASSSSTASKVLMSLIVEIPVIKFSSSLKNASSMFKGCEYLKSFPLINTSNITTATSMFENCASLQTVAAIDLSSVTNTQSMFKNSGIKNVPVFNLASVTGLGGMYNGCSYLTNESLNNILASLPTATSYSSTKTLNYLGLSSTQATTCIGLSNWSAAETAGWSTGY